MHELTWFRRKNRL